MYALLEPALVLLVTDAAHAVSACSRPTILAIPRWRVAMLTASCCLPGLRHHNKQAARMQQSVHSCWRAVVRDASAILAARSATRRCTPLESGSLCIHSDSALALSAVAIIQGVSAHTPRLATLASGACAAAPRRVKKRWRVHPARTAVTCDMTPSRQCVSQL